MKAWEAFYSGLRRLAGVVFPTLTEPLRSREELRAMVGDEAVWEAIFETPLGRTLADTFADELVSGVALTDGLIGTFAEAEEPSLRQNRCFLYHVIGRGTGAWQVPVGGMGAVSRALAGAAAAAGAELRTGTEVLALATAGEAVEVSFADAGGEHTVRARHLLAGAAPAELERLLGGPSPDRPPEGSQLKVNLLLLAAASPARQHSRARAGLRGDLPHQRDGRPAAPCIRAGGGGNHPGAAAVRGLLPLAGRPRDPRPRAARGGRPDADPVRAAHACPPVQARTPRVPGGPPCRRPSHRSTASWPSRSASAWR